VDAVRFADVWQAQGFKSFVLVSVAMKEVTDPFCGCVANNGVAEDSELEKRNCCWWRGVLQAGITEFTSHVSIKVTLTQAESALHAEE
jgi:hypothetical protein